MLYTPIIGFAAQVITQAGQVASDYYLKFYEANTTTPLSMATDGTGAVTLVKAKLGDLGYAVSNPLDNSTIFIPHVNAPYRLVIYTNETDADNNTTANAYVNIPEISPPVSLAQIGTGAGQVPLNSDLGTAATKDTGVGAGQVPLNSDLGTAATKDTGTGAGEVPTNADVRVPRNRIVNPIGAISQENGDGVVVVDNSAEFYLADEIHTRSEAGAGGQFTTEATNLDGLRARKLTVTSATTNLTGPNDAGRIVSKLESINVFDLNGGAVTWTRVIKTNFTGKLSLAFRGSANTRSYVTELDVVSGVTKKHVVVLDFEAATVDANNNGIGIEVLLALDNNGSVETAALDQWQAGTFLSSATATNWTQTTGNYIEFTAHGLYKGSIAPEFQPNSYAYDLAECQRYFETSYDGAVGTATATNEIRHVNTSSNFRVPFSMKVTKRSTPVIILYSPTTGNSGKVGGTITPELTASVGNLGTVNGTVSGSGANSSEGIRYHYTANARL